MEEILNQAISSSKLQPVLYFVGFFVVLGVSSLGGTVLSFWLRGKNDKDNKIEHMSLALARVETKLDFYIDRHERDVNELRSRIGI